MSGLTLRYGEDRTTGLPRLDDPSGQLSPTDLRALHRKDARTFTLMLLAGYLHVGDALSRRSGEPGDSRYAAAADAVRRLAGESLVARALDPLLTPGAPATQTAIVAAPEPEG